MVSRRIALAGAIAGVAPCWDTGNSSVSSEVDIVVWYIGASVRCEGFAGLVPRTTPLICLSDSHDAQFVVGLLDAHMLLIPLHECQ